MADFLPGNPGYGAAFRTAAMAALSRIANPDERTMCAESSRPEALSRKAIRVFPCMRRRWATQGYCLAASMRARIAA